MQASKLANVPVVAIGSLIEMVKMYYVQLLGWIQSIKGGSWMGIEEVKYMWIGCLFVRAGMSR